METLDDYTVDRVEFVVAPREVVRYFVRFKKHYRDGHTSTTKYKSFATLRGAASRIAWWIIGERYDVAMQQFDALPKDYRFPAFLPGCDCWDRSRGWDGCALHDRDNGYFSRLHDRVADWIEKGYLMKGAIQETGG